MATTTVTRKKIKRGDTWKATYSWFQGNYPLDLTSATVRLQLRAKQTYALALSISTDSGELTIPNPGNGQVVQEVPAADMEAVDPAVYWCDIEVSLPGGTVRSSETFEVEVEQDIAFDE